MNLKQTYGNKTNMKYFLNDWCIFEYGDVVVKNYPEQFSHFTYKDALKQQAIDIYENTGIKTVFISGGIDSQTKALAFIEAGIDCKIVFIRNTFGEKSNDRELFYASEFCKRHKKELTIFQVDYDFEKIEQLFFDKQYFTTSIGSGNIFQYDAMEKYMEMYNEKLVVGIGYFFMNRKDDICYGSFLKPNFGYMKGIDIKNIVLFDTYSPHVFKYYEYVHRNTPEIQFLQKYAGKSLSYVELGMPFRPKLNSWEFLDFENDYFQLSSIDWSDDHSYKARLTLGVDVIAKLFKFDKYRAEKMKTEKSFDQSKCYIKLYEFKTDVNYKV